MFVESKWIAVALSPYNHKTRVIRDIALHGFTQGENCLLQKKIAAIEKVNRECLSPEEDYWNRSVSQNMS